MISKKLFLEKYPFFWEDKDWLVKIQNLKWWEFVYLWYLIDQYFVRFSPFFSYCWISADLTENTNFMLTGVVTYLSERLPNLDCRIRFDLDNISPRSFYKDGELWWSWEWLPTFDLEKILSKRGSIVSRKFRRNSKFHEFMWNIIHTTEFWYQSVDTSLQIEEITDIIFNGLYVNRYLHTEFNPINKTIKHFDGSLLFYNADNKTQRSKVRLDCWLKNANKDVKLFRIDGNVPQDEWLSIIYHWFIRNELILEWFNPQEYQFKYKETLDPLIDG